MIASLETPRMLNKLTMLRTDQCDREHPRLTTPGAWFSRDNAKYCSMLFIDGILYAFQEETNDAVKEWEEGEPDLRRISDKLETEKASLNAMGGRRIEISDSFMTDKGVVMHRNSTASLLAAWCMFELLWDEK
ncbi:hypothetical protein Tco_1382193 [Tanacetum coccineum]